MALPYDLSLDDRYWIADQTGRQLWYGIENETERKATDTALFIMNPAVGTWRVGIEGDTQSFKAFYMLIGKIQFTIDVDRNPNIPRERTISVWPNSAEYRNSLENDDYEAYCQIVSIQKNVSDASEFSTAPKYDEKIPLEYVPESHEWKGNFSAPSPGDYLATIFVCIDSKWYSQSANIKIESGPGHDINFRFKTPISKQTVEAVIPSWEKDMEVRIIGWQFVKTEGDSKNRTIVEITSDGADSNGAKRIILKSKNNGSGNLDVTVKDLLSSQTWTIRYPVHVGPVTPTPTPTSEPTPTLSGGSTPVPAEVSSNENKENQDTRTLVARMSLFFALAICAFLRIYTFFKLRGTEENSAQKDR